MSGDVFAMSLQPDGKIVVGGLFTLYNVTARPRIARLNSDGTLDTSFATAGTGFDNTIYALSLQADGKIWVGGLFTSYNGTACPSIARLNADGSLDTSFSATGSGLNSYVRTISLQKDGKPLVGGQFSSYNGTSRPYVARLNVDGALDTGFAPTGAGLNSMVYSLLAQSNGKVLVTGQFRAYDTTTATYLARLTYIGSLD